MRTAVTATAIAKPQHLRRLGMSTPTMPAPIATKAIASERGRIATEAQVDVASIIQHIVDAMRDDAPSCPTGIIVVQRPNRFGRVNCFASVGR